MRLPHPCASVNPDEGSDTRGRILAAAVELIETGGVAAVTTRSVAQAAGVLPPAIYRAFGDKERLLDAVADRVFTDYIARQSAFRRDDDPVEQLAAGIDAHIAFGLAHPAVFVLISAPPDGQPGPVMRAGLAVLAERIGLVAAAGRLRVSEEAAVALVHSVATGMVLTLIGRSADARGDLAVIARKSALRLILAEDGCVADDAFGPMLATLRSRIPQMPDFTPGERLFMDEMLARASDKVALSDS